MKTEDCFRIGSVLKTKGLKGELQLYIDFEDIEKVKFNSLFIDIVGKLVPYFVSSIKYLQKNQAYLFLEDVDSIEKASMLAKKDIYLPNKLKPKKKKEEFTLKDVKGFIAVDETHGELGEIMDVLEYPQQLIAQVQFNGKEVLFPLNVEIIKGIDVEGGEIYIDLPEGLLDVYLEG
ncbi:16S rRNA processing protein RimM [Mucilaginibacter pallidiroseus]|uniref:Ribosome maturation factor RimM n=1 Tax=Mucilaginibacter pallidiroseus TaxID=2599295 RepID=A0A563UEP3_9SPHI|nr:ribosome maturation factor RimM [Mucilaginibacter pallidiroseus]TWR29824.1 16S rRNA processing protein RimM [Mucilaginibacter pallidiroseus]